MFRIMFADHASEFAIACVSDRAAAEALALRWNFTKGGRYWVA